MSDWHELGPADPVVVSEAWAQTFFNGWWGDSLPEKFDVAGLPAWLDEMHPGERDEIRPQVRHTTDFRYAFISDVEWGPEGKERAVLELKSAHKYEPIGLPEVLHHAQMIESHPAPILVTRPSAWNRAAIQYLRDHGLAGDALRYVELELICLPDGSTLAWFDDPFARWRLETSPPNHPSSHLGPLRWFRVDDTAEGCPTWIGVATAVDAGERRPLLMSDYMTVTQTRRGAWVAWQSDRGRGTYCVRAA